MKEVVIKINKGKQVLLILACVLFVLIGIYFITDDEMSLLFRGLLMVCILFFGFAFFAILKQLIKNDYLAKMNNQGLYIYGFANTCFLWADINNIIEYTFNGQKLIGIELENEGVYLERLPVVSHKTCKMNKGIGFPTFSFSALSSNYTSDELLKLTQEYWAYYRDNIDSCL